ncbi:MAG: hypothetical protein ACTSWY_16140 [Promethearchaeota archaeon]
MSEDGVNEKKEKKVKNEDGDGVDNPLKDDAESSESEIGTKEEIILNISPNTQKYIEKELGMIKFLDFLSEENFDLAFQDKIIVTYKEQFFKIFFNTDEYENNELHNEFQRLKVEEAVDSIKSKSEEIALKNGYKTSFTKRTKRANLITTGVLFAALILLMIIPNLAADVKNMLMWPLLIVFCILPQLIRKRMTGKWKDFKSFLKEEFQEEMKEEINRIKQFNQIALDDCRNFMLDKEFPLPLLKFNLISNDYAGLKLLKSNNLRKNEIQYVFQFEYPEGVDPLPMPTKVLQQGLMRTSTEIPDDDENDLFIILSNTDYSEEGWVIIKNQKYISVELQQKVESVLDNSNFKKLEKPGDILLDFKNNKEILCSCETPVKFAELQSIDSQSYPEFGYYIGICEKCAECGKNPFVLFAMRDSKIPDDLKDIFEM